MSETSPASEIETLLDNKVEDVLALLNDLPVDQLNEAFAAEKKAKNRSGVIEAITKKITEHEELAQQLAENSAGDQAPAPETSTKASTKKAVPVDMLGRPLKKA